MYSMSSRKRPLDGLFQTDPPIGSFHEYPQRVPMLHAEEYERCAGALKSFTGAVQVELNRHLEQ